MLLLWVHHPESKPPGISMATTGNGPSQRCQHKAHAQAATLESWHTGNRGAKSAHHQHCRQALLTGSYSTRCRLQACRGFAPLRPPQGRCMHVQQQHGCTLRHARAPAVMHHSRGLRVDMACSHEAAHVCNPAWMSQKRRQRRSAHTAQRQQPCHMTAGWAHIHCCQAARAVGRFTLTREGSQQHTSVPPAQFLPLQALPEASKAEQSQA